jgi:hypothetical protein
MRIFILLLTAMIFFSCKENVKPTRMTDYKKTDTLYIKELSNELYKFNFSYSKDSQHPHIIKCKKILITDLSRGLQIQEIKIDTIEMNERNIYFSIDEDVNFDGYSDICVLNYEGNYNSSFSFWIFDKENENFKYYKGLDNIYNPAMLSDKKIICSKWHSGLSNFNIEKYFWQNDSLILKEKYEENWMDKGYLTITKLVNKKYVVKDSIISDRVVEKMNCQ